MAVGSSRHRSIVGTEFEGDRRGDVGRGRPAVVTEVAGAPTGRHEFVLEPDDVLGKGFLLR